MAVSKERKSQLIDQYGSWIDQSVALFLTEYRGLTVQQISELRSQLREVGGEFHVIKNTLGKIVFDQRGLTYEPNFFQGTTAIGFAFEAAPVVAKTLAEFAPETEFLKVKGGYLGDRVIGPADVKALAELPPLPIVRSQLLGVLQAPAGKLARMLAEPGRQLAGVVKAYVDRDAQSAAA